jgi:hypothetical protein
VKVVAVDPLCLPWNVEAWAQEQAEFFDHLNILEQTLVADLIYNLQNRKGMERDYFGAQD